MNIKDDVCLREKMLAIYQQFANVFCCTVVFNLYLSSFHYEGYFLVVLGDVAIYADNINK